MGHVGFSNKASNYKVWLNRWPWQETNLLPNFWFLDMNCLHPMIVLRIGIKIDSVTYEKLISKKHDHNFLTQIKFDFFFSHVSVRKRKNWNFLNHSLLSFCKSCFFFDLVMTFLCQDIQECLVVSLQYFEVRIYILDSLILFSLFRSASVLF